MLHPKKGGRGVTNENRCTNLDGEPMTLHATIDCQCSWNCHTRLH